MTDDEQIENKIVELETEHRDLDDVIRRMQEGVYTDQVQLKRFKKKKLLLKDTIAKLKSSLIPDVSA